MNRRSLLGLSLAALLGVPGSRAQSVAAKGRVYRIAAIRDGLTPAGAPRSPRFEELLAARGFRVGENLRIDYVFTENKPELLQAKIREMLAREPDVIFTAFSYRVKAIQAQTKTVPIVFWAAGDPVKVGVVRDYARPGGNATGVAFFYEEVAAKRLEIARELLPRGKRVALIADYRMMQGALAAFPADLEQQAGKLGFEIVHGDVSAHGGDLRATLAAVEAKRPDALLPFGVLPTVGEGRGVLEIFEQEWRVPLIGDVPGFGVVSFGADEDDHFRRAVEIVARILKGARPQDVPVDRDTRFELVVNLARARAIGLAIPDRIRVRADRVLPGAGQ